MRDALEGLSLVLKKKNKFMGNKKSLKKKNLQVISFRGYFIKALMGKGRRLAAEKFLESVLFNFKSKTIYVPMEVFNHSTKKIKPLLSLRNIRIGTTFYKIPTPLNTHRQRFLTAKLLFSAAASSRRSINYDTIADFLLAIYLGENNSPTDSMFSIYREAMRNKQLL